VKLLGLALALAMPQAYAEQARSRVDAGGQSGTRDVLLVILVVLLVLLLV
jgi:hypothetical protein